MRYAVFGGSFDPPHLAHVMACLWALSVGEVDGVLVIPVAHHAFGKRQAAPFPHRMEMCRRAVAPLGSAVEVSDIEERRGGTSYMVDTLEQLLAERPGARLRLLVGSDVAADVPRWHRGDRVLELAPLLVVPRPREDDRFSDRPGALPLISSTAVREVLRTGAEVGHLLPAVVRNYIAAHALYQDPGEPTP